ncbi:hypothetical protein M109_3170 [Bacteroides fragilis str. 3397 N2]|nr:hypothetical protein M109_3170 [Bacteroides fragilis str. 3397 N2]EXZ52869.1 hypothetical protein M108_3252 [Bacteroides fragilis str. 3397 T14]EYA42535.1 hypothetical protein M110_3295 [Bacteroides fragilis str. 3397 N3]
MMEAMPSLFLTAIFLIYKKALNVLFFVSTILKFSFQKVATYFSYQEFCKTI